MLRLLSLLQNHRFWSGAELSKRLEVSERTLRRDIDRLRDLGYPVEASRGHAGGYQLSVGAALPPLLLEDDEAVAIALGLRTAAAGAVAGLEESALQALTKVAAVMPPKLRRRVEAVASTSVHTVRRGPPLDAGVLTLLARACRDHEQIRFDYTGRAATDPSRRRVEPHSVASVGQRWYLIAFDLDRSDWRTFRVDRIGQPDLSRVRFAPRELPEGLDPVGFVRRNHAGIPRRYEVVLLLAADATTVARTVMAWARVDPAEFPGQPQRPACRVTLRTDDLTAPMWLLAEVDVDFVVVSPPELNDRIRRLGERAATVSGNATGVLPTHER